MMATVPDGFPLLIRADASTRIGTGHLMRCLALAQAWKDSGGRVVFITACESAGLLQRLSDEGFQVVTVKRFYPDPADWEATSQVLVAHPNAWVVLDGYHFDPAYQILIKEAGHPLLVIDDMAHLPHYYADIVLNQNLHADQLHYSCEPYTKLLRGTRYVLLRREFLKWRSWKREIPEVARKVLVTSGGADPHNVTLKVIRAINKLKFRDLEVKVVIGPSNPHMASLKEVVHRSPFTIHLLLDVRNMPELMAWADLAISSGGSTCWEMTFLGLPNVILELAENQRGIAEGLDSCGVALNAGWYAEISELDLTQILKTLMFNPASRKTMSEEGQKLVHGTGTDKVISVMHKVEQSSLLSDHLQVRPARLEDVELLWRWTNDQVVRTNSFHPEPVPYNKHIKWYQEKLQAPNTRIWILELDRKPAGHVRYDRVDTDEAVISFSIAADYRGKGISTKALVLTSGMACRELGVKRLKGVVFLSNEASRRAFAKAAFQCIGEEKISGKLCHIYARECSESIREGV